VLLAGNGVGKDVQVTRLQRFFSEARDDLFQLVAYSKQPQPSIGYGFAKISSAVEARILDKLFRHVSLAVHLRNVTGAGPILVHRIAHYFIKCFDFVPFFRSDRDGLKKSEDYKEYRLDRPAALYVAAINSSLFYLYWQVFFDAFKAGKHCVESFPIGTPSAEIESTLLSIGERLSADLKRNSTRLAATYKQTGQVEYDQFFPRLSKALMDEADFTLAKHYGLSDHELDVVVNYDFKFRTSARTDADD
jgi:hypothetical protein